MTVATVESPRSISIRPLAVPNEHGGWSFLLEPIVLALVVAPSLAGGLLAVAAVLAFLTRHPLKLAAQDFMRGRRLPRTRACEWIAAGYGIAASGSMLMAIIVGGAWPLSPLAVGLLFAALQFRLDVRGKGRTLLAELCGACGAATVATAIAAAAKAPWPLAASLAVLAAARGLPSTMFVRSLRRRQGAAWTIVAHIVALQCAAALWRLEIAPITAVVAMTLLLLRATVGLRRESPRAMTIGLQEVGWGVAVVALIAGGYILR